MRQWVRKVRPTTKKSIYFWNMAGSLCNAAKTVLLTMACSWLIGDARTGVFSLALATSQMLRPVGGFELRSAYVTDSRREFTLPSMMGFSVFSNFAMMAAAAVLAFARGYTGEKAAAVMLMCLFMLVQNISEVIGGQFQREEHLELAGKSLAFSIVLTSAMFFAALAATRALVPSMALIVAAEIVWVCAYDVPYVRSMGGCRPRFGLSEMRSIFVTAVPLCVSSFLQSYLITASRYAIDTYLNDTMQAVYSYLFMPVSVINLFSIFFYRPVLTAMAASWHDRRFGDFAGYVRRQLLLIAAASAVVLAGGWIAGVQVLGLVYHTDLAPYRIALMVALAGGMFSACNSFAYYVLATLRCQRVMSAAYAAASLLMVLFSGASVRTLGLLGAFVIYTAVMAVLTAVLYGVALWVYIRTKREGDGR